MIKIKKFTATDLEFSEIARVRNLVNHDSIDHPDEDKNDWAIRDKGLIKDRLLLYNDTITCSIYKNSYRFYVWQTYSLASQQRCYPDFSQIAGFPKGKLHNSTLIKSFWLLLESMILTFQVPGPYEAQKIKLP